MIWIMILCSDFDSKKGEVSLWCQPRSRTIWGRHRELSVVSLLMSLAGDVLKTALKTRDLNRLQAVIKLVFAMHDFYFTSRGTPVKIFAGFAYGIVAVRNVAAHFYSYEKAQLF